MKRILLSVVVVIGVFGCKNEVKNDYSILSGKISNLEKDFKISGFNFKKTIEVNDDGTFNDTLKIEDGYFKLYTENKGVDLFLTKGKDLSISFDVSDTTDTYTFVGSTKKENEFLVKKEKTKKDLYGDVKSLFTLNETEYLAKLKSVKEELSKLIIKANISEKFKKSELKKLEFNNKVNTFLYPNYHGYFTGDKDFKVSENYPDVLEGLDLNDEETYKLSSSFRELVSRKYGKLVNTMLEKDSLSGSSEYFNTLLDLINEKATSQLIKDDLLYNQIKFGLSYVDNLGDFYNKYMKSSTNKEFQEKITQLYEKLKVTAKGETSPKFVNYENYKGGTSSLDDFKGKYVYVDVWATWCGPCKAEIPSLKKVEEDYHNKNIVFVSISIDPAKDHDAWKKMVADKELKGVQLFADKDWKSDFVKGYSINGIPRFILIDPEGKIVSSNAPRPSSPELIKLFNSLKI